MTPRHKYVRCTGPANAIIYIIGSKDDAIDAMNALVKDKKDWLYMGSTED